MIRPGFAACRCYALLIGARREARHRVLSVWLLFLGFNNREVRSLLSRSLLGLKRAT